ncbi:Abi family protein [Arthrobacter glacialis]|uniref:Uncharacterized protein n=1 Tax=Arthrobacter glacialis TaxID=1664 RepID=A0A2S3ZRN3_ARTGL|nr:Abi family protein [Arthrobacter glacialis]POH71769.1 hypothetical protein CVS27_19330 [Arthrobacter glacialis]
MRSLGSLLIDFDRDLRLLVLDGIERIEVSLRMQIGYILGQASHSPTCARQRSWWPSRTTPSTHERAHRRAATHSGCNDWMHDGQTRMKHS